MSRRQELEAIVNLIGRQIAEEMADALSGPPVGFLFLVFDFGEDGFCAHISNARREDTVKLLREHADRLEARTESTRGDA